MTGGMLGLGGVVPWEWLASCRDCGQTHQYMPSVSGPGSWGSSGCGTYRPRLSRWVLDTLMVEHRAGEESEGL